MHFVKATLAKRPKELSVWAASLYLALFYVVAAVSQLFAFEDYPKVIASIGLPGIDWLALPFAALIVTLEIAAIPFLLMMRMSPLMRVLSMISGWTVLFIWFVIAVWAVNARYFVSNIGLFGSKLAVPEGWWLVCYIIALITLSALVSYNLWPKIKRLSRKRIVKD